jgi:hypothetical protein
MSNPDTSFHKSSNEDIDKEVRNLIRKNAGKHKSNSSILDDLREKYGKDKNIINAIVGKYNEKMAKVKKFSQKIKEKLMEKYPNLTHKEYIQKISSYKAKYGFDESEAQGIINEIFMNMNKEHYDPNDAYSMSNEMTKALGFVPASYNLSGSLHIEKDQMEALQEIIRYDEATGDLHDQVILQSTIYDGVKSDLVDLNGIEKQKINIFSFVHPVVAALFLHKFKIIDEHMIIASISKIIHQKYKGIELQTQPEYELYWNISTDPAETACVTKSKPFEDLLKRVIVQVKLMESVLNLRQGKFYMGDLSSFILAIDNCRASVFDAADLAYVKDEGTILRKLLAAFSLRPTIVLTRPVYTIASAYSNIPVLAAGHITSLPMITIRLPNNNGGVIYRDAQGNAQSIVDIQSALKSQPQLYIHHRQIVQKEQEILYSREILIFYVHRRYFDINTRRLKDPYMMAQLPVTMAAFERLNSTPIIVNPSVSISDGSVYNIRSIVQVQTKPVDIDGKQQDAIICCNASTILHPNKGIDGNDTLFYEPLDIGSKGNIRPVKWLPTSKVLEDAEQKGTIFIYSSKTENEKKNETHGSTSNTSSKGTGSGKEEVKEEVLTSGLEKS